MNLNQWAIKWGISYDAIAELKSQMIDCPEPDLKTNGRDEQSVQNMIRLAASQKGWRLWRNNVGVLTDARGIPVRFGLLNDSKAVNQQVKSSDLIGINDKGQFVAREVKKPGWKYTGTEREKAQLKFIEMINALGGDAKFTTGEL